MIKQQVAIFVKFWIFFLKNIPIGLESDIQIYIYICDISAFYFGADFPFNIGLYDNFHYLWVTKQLVMDILLNLFT